MMLSGQHVLDCFDNQEDGVNITANSLHPGVIATNLFRHNMSLANDNPIRGFTFYILTPLIFLVLLQWTRSQIQVKNSFLTSVLLI
jgi:NAD(P)-dependent dehydrogenase (short-subunit alcohol dehydrogenase family)